MNLSNSVFVDLFYDFLKRKNIFFKKTFINEFISTIVDAAVLNSNNYNMLYNEILNYSKNYDLSEIIEPYNINLLNSSFITIDKDYLTEIVHIEDIGNCQFREIENKDFEKLDGFDILDDEDNSNNNSRYTKYSPDKCVFKLKLKLSKDFFIFAVEKDQFIFSDVFKNNEIKKNIKLLLLPGLKVVSGVVLLKKTLVNIII